MKRIYLKDLSKHSDYNKYKSKQFIVMCEVKRTKEIQCCQCKVLNGPTQERCDRLTCLEVKDREAATPN